MQGTRSQRHAPTSATHAVAILSVCVLLSANIACAEDAAAKGKKLEPLAAVIAAVDAADELADEAEEAYRSLAASGNPDPLATYALALTRLQQSQFSGAAELLDGLPAGAQRSLPIQRVRLWLALQRRDWEQGASLLSDLQQRLAKGSASDQDLTETARFLGGLAGMLHTGESADELISKDLAAATATLSKDANPKFAGVYRQANDLALRRRRELQEVVKGVAAKGIEAAKKELPGLQKEVKRLSADLAESVTAEKDQRKQGADLSSRRRDLQGDAVTINRALRVPTPRRPVQPPKLYYKQDEDDKKKGEPEETEASQKAQKHYEKHLADWEQRDKERREELQTKGKAIDASLAEIDQLAERNAAEADALKEQCADQRGKLSAAQARCQVLQTMCAAKDETSAAGILVQPSAYELLSFPAEKRRLTQALKR